MTLRAMMPRRCAALTLLLAAGAAQASPFGIFDPRSAAMGGTGVASGTAGNASYFNPALLAAASPRDKFAFEMPIVSARAYDPDDLRNDIDPLKQAGDSVTSAINAFNQSPSTAGAAQISNTLGAFRTQLNSVNNKTAEANAFAAPLTIAMPGKNLGWGIYAAGRGDIGVKAVYASSDDALLQTLQADAAACAGSGSMASAACTSLISTWTGTGGQINNLQSRFLVRGAALLEGGVSLAHQFESLGGLALGVTPKAVKVITYDYSISSQQAQVDLSMGRKDYSTTNVDVGMARDLGGGFKLGVVGKNLVSRDFDTVLGNTIQLRPQYRAGAAYTSKLATLAVDVDLKENAPISFDKPTRYAGAGVEFDLGLLKLRGGYRTDLTHNYKGAPSAGLGLSIAGWHLDAAVAGRNRDEVIAALQLGYRY